MSDQEPKKPRRSNLGPPPKPPARDRPTSSSDSPTPDDDDGDDPTEPADQPILLGERGGTQVAPIPAGLLNPRFNTEPMAQRSGPKPVVVDEPKTSPKMPVPTGAEAALRVDAPAPGGTKPVMRVDGPSGPLVAPPPSTGPSPASPPQPATPPVSPPEEPVEAKPVVDHPARPMAGRGPSIGVAPAHLSSHVHRSRAYRFVLDETGQPIELGSGRTAKVFLGEEFWLDSKTAFRRNVAIKVLQRGGKPEDAMRFVMEKELLERVQGHPGIVDIYASGESDNPEFIPPSLRGTLENDFMVIELCDMSLEEHVKGLRSTGREDLLRFPMRDRLFRVLEYVLPVASALEYAHLECNVCHRDIKPGSVLLKLANPRLQGSSLEVRLADFNVGKLRDEQQDISVTSVHRVPGTQFFQSPEQESNAFELLVNVQQGKEEVTYFEDFPVGIAPNDMFRVFNRGQHYRVRQADPRRNALVLDRPYIGGTENSVRAQLTKAVDRPADIYSLGALLYYLITGASGNPKSLFEAFRKFIDYEVPADGGGAQNTIEAYLDHEYAVLGNLRTPRVDDNNQPMVAPADQFFGYKHYLDGNGELIDKETMKIVAKAMIRNKSDSYCQAWDVHTAGMSLLVDDLRRLYGAFGTYMPSRPGHLVVHNEQRSGAISRAWGVLRGALGGDRRKK